MKFNFSHRPVSGPKLALIALAFAVLAISVASARAWLRSAPAAPPEPQTHDAAQGDSGRGDVEAEVITLLPTGFNPSEITRPRGRFLILIENRSGLDEVTFSLSRSDGHRLRAAKRTKEDLIWRQIEDLHPGEYLLSEAGHPEWVCRITVTPH